MKVKVILGALHVGDLVHLPGAVIDLAEEEARKLAALAQPVVEIIERDLGIKPKAGADK